MKLCFKKVPVCVSYRKPPFFYIVITNSITRKIKIKLRNNLENICLIYLTVCFYTVKDYICSTSLTCWQSYLFITVILIRYSNYWYLRFPLFPRNFDNMTNHWYFFFFLFFKFLYLTKDFARISVLVVSMPTWKFLLLAHLWGQLHRSKCSPVLSIEDHQD